MHTHKNITLFFVGRGVNVDEKNGQQSDLEGEISGKYLSY